MFPFSGKTASQIDVHVATRHIYWCDPSKKSTLGSGIHRSGTDGAGYKRIISNGFGDKGIQGIAVDWVAGKATISPPEKSHLNCVFWQGDIGCLYMLTWFLTGICLIYSFYCSILLSCQYGN